MQLMHDSRPMCIAQKEPYPKRKNFKPWILSIRQQTCALIVTDFFCILLPQLNSWHIASRYAEYCNIVHRPKYIWNMHKKKLRRKFYPNLEEKEIFFPKF